jgi:hypothetical protein
MEMTQMVGRIMDQSSLLASPMIEQDSMIDRGVERTRQFDLTRHFDETMEMTQVVGKIILDQSALLMTPLEDSRDRTELTRQFDVSMELTQVRIINIFHFVLETFVVVN